MRVKLAVGEPKPTVLVTERAIGTDQGRKYVLVVNDKNAVEYREVQLGPLADGLRAVASGLRTGRVGDRERHPARPAGDHRRPAARRDGTQGSRGGAREPSGPGRFRLARETPRDDGAMLARFFVDRPIFATVISIVIILIGLVALNGLPIAQYPEVVPPTVSVSTTYPGASAKVVADTVAAPIEQEVNGVEGMLYMLSKSGNDGSMTLDVTFRTGTNLDFAQVLTQNRVAIAEAKLPEEVKRQGVTVKKKSPMILLCVNLLSPDGRYDQLYLSNYATIQVKDALARLPGVGDVSFLGARDYSMRVWLDPTQLAARSMTASDVVNALREQNVQVAAGRIGQPPAPAGLDFQYTINTLGRLLDPEQFAQIVLKTGEQGQITRLADVGRVELGSKSYDVSSYLDGQPSVTHRALPAARARTRSPPPRASAPRWSGSPSASRRAWSTGSSTTPRSS